MEGRSTKYNSNAPLSAVGMGEKTMTSRSKMTVEEHIQTARDFLEASDHEFSNGTSCRVQRSCGAPPPTP